ncbi:MAG: MotA/TolQ/ExbB proton channel family protein [Desulfobacterales bacterium]|nr:MotA/TolQ/ExbB proton channel family protein [Desulfobacterales bacterium]
MLELLSKGGILVVPIVACSVLVLAIFLERCIRLALIRKRGKGIENQVVEQVTAGEMSRAATMARESQCPMGRVLDKAIEARDMDAATQETLVVNATEQEVRGMSAHLQTLATIGNIAPILGLLGTIIGMIKAFMVIQEMGGKVNAAVLAGGIWEAMLTTAMGLSVALPAMLAHSYLCARVDAQESRLQNGLALVYKAMARGKH